MKMILIQLPNGQIRQVGDRYVLSEGEVRIRSMDIEDDKSPMTVDEELEQLQVQLAGCGVAALGGTKDPAREGDYGWSPTYQDVLDLRLKYEELLKEGR